MKNNFKFKIYFVKQDNMFYDAKNKTFTQKAFLATIFTEYKNAQKIIINDKLLKATIEEDKERKILDVYEFLGWDLSMFLDVLDYKINNFEDKFTAFTQVDKAILKHLKEVKKLLKQNHSWIEKYENNNEEYVSDTRTDLIEISENISKVAPTNYKKLNAYLKRLNK